jgi:hypothetical protein
MFQRASNFQLNVAEGVSFQVAMGFISPTAVLPLFVATFTDQKWALGLLGALFVLGALPQALGASYTARCRDFLALARVQMMLPRLALLALALAPWLPASVALVGFFLLVAGFQLALGFATPTWLEFVHHALPVERQGALFGRRKAWGAALSLVAMLASGSLLTALPAPWGFRACFMLAALAWLVAYPCILATRLPVVPTAKTTVRRGFLATALVLLNETPDFRRYLLGRCLLAGSGMASAFYVVYGVSRYHLPVGVATLLPIVLTVLPALPGDAWGRWIDQHGARRALAPMALLAALAHVVMLLVPSPAAFAMALLCVGAASVVLEIADGQFLLGLGAERCGTATGVLGLALLPFTAGLPLLAGLLADAHGMGLVLGLAGLAWGLGAVALVLVAPVVRRFSPVYG